MLFLTLVSLGVQILDYVVGREELHVLLTRFEVGDDASIPTWYSSFALLLCSILLATVAAAKKRYRDRYVLHWSFLSIIFLLLSVDEVATLHEAGGGAVELLVESIGYTPSGFFYTAWVIPGIIFALVVALAYLRFLAHLPSKTRILFLVAGAIFVAGALGMEMLSARLISFYGYENLESIPFSARIVISMQTAVEELLEMLGVVVFIYALLSYISSYVKEVSVQVRTDRK